MRGLLENREESTGEKYVFRFQWNFFAYSVCVCRLKIFIIRKRGKKTLSDGSYPIDETETPCYF